MSKRSQRRKRRQKKHNHFPKPMGQKEKHSKKHKQKEIQQTPSVEVNQTHSLGIETKKNSTGKKDPVEVTETVRHFAETVKKSETVNTTIKEPTLPAFTPVIVPLTINNTLIKKYYKVVKKPSSWATATCKYIGQIGKCDATHHKYGARLEFESGEKVYLGFDGLEIAADPKSTRRRIPLPEHLRIDIERTPEPAAVKPVSDKPSVTDATAKKGSFYKVVRKPARWKVACKFLNKTGKCIAIDDRGVRLRFEDGTDVSFEPECLEEVISMDLNNQLPKNGITEDNFQFGELFIVTSKPENLHDNGDQLVGKIGKGIWANYHGICVKFDGGAGYVIYFENLERYNPNRQIDNPVKVPTKLSANNVVFGRKYKFTRIRPGSTSDHHLIGQLAEIKWASDLNGGGCRIAFATGEEMTVPFECLEEQKRPTDFELIELIKKNPHRILRIVKGLERITKLKPVQDFVRKGILPQPIPAPPRVPDTNSEIFGPEVPRCMTDPYYGHCDESTEAESRVVA